MDTAQTEPPFDLTPEQEELLLQIARAALERAVQTGQADEAWLPPTEVPDDLLEEGASFVTLHVDGALRGCIGSARAYRPLALDVASNAMRASLFDPRFARIAEDELPRTSLEISILTPLTPLEYESSTDLIARLRPHVDGVMIIRDVHRALLLPQTWEMITDANDFMAALCHKAGLPSDAYQEGALDVYTFQVHTIEEPAVTRET